MEHTQEPEEGFESPSSGGAGVWPLPTLDGRLLEFETDFASVTLEGSSERAGSLVVHGRLAPRLSVDIQEEGSRVLVRVKRRESGLPGWGFWDWGPHMQVTLHLPADVRGRVTTSAGRTRVSGFQDCELELTTDAGTLALEDVHGRLTLRTSAGKIDGERVGGLLDVENNAGAVALSIDALSPGEHTIHTDVGSIRLDLAPQVEVRIEAHATMGGIKVDHPSTPGAAAVLSVSTDVGSVRVRGDRGARHQARQERHQRRHEARASRSAGSTSSVAVPVTGGPSAAPPEDAEVGRILTMVSEGKLSPHDAHDLLRALGRA